MVEDFFTNYTFNFVGASEFNNNQEWPEKGQNPLKNVQATNF